MRHRIFFLTALWANISFFALMTSVRAIHQPTVIPFELWGNSIFVQASVNGQAGNFLIDTGAPNLILNNAHFQGVAVPGFAAGILDLHGVNSETLLLAVEEFILGALVFPEKYALVSDLQPIAAIKGRSLLGIIGYSTLKNFELHFDFERQELTFFPLGKKGEPAMGTWQEAPTEIFDLKFSGHIPYVISMVGGKKIRVGIDSGSEVNLLHDRFFEKSGLRLEDARKVQLYGLSGDHSAAQRGSLSGILLEEYIAGPMDITLTDLQPVNELLPINLDGILGVAYLKKIRFSFNYKKREFCIWSPHEKAAPLAENKKPVTLEARMGGPRK